MIFNHVNNSGFWVISRFFNLDLKQGLKYITLPDAVSGSVLLCSDLRCRCRGPVLIAYSL